MALYNSGGSMSDLMRQYAGAVQAPSTGVGLSSAGGLTGGTSMADASSWVNQPYKWKAKKKWTQNVVTWQDFWKRMSQQSLGLAGREAFDPLALLQSKLTSASEETQIPSLTPEDIGKQLRVRNTGVSSQLQQRAASMGMPGIYEGALTAQDRARQTMTDRAWATYFPQEFERRKSYDEQISQLVTAIAQAKFEQEKNIRTG